MLDSIGYEFFFIDALFRSTDGQTESLQAIADILRAEREFQRNSYCALQFRLSTPLRSLS